MNSCCFVGRLTKEVEVREFESGKKKASFTLAVDREYQKEKSDFITCVIWGDIAGNLSKYIGKGSLVAVRGSLEQRSYEKNGETRYLFEINVQKIDFLEKKKKEEVEKPPIEEETYYQPSIDEDDSAMLPFSLE